MKKSVSRFLLCLNGLVLVACSTTNGPVTIRDVDTRVPVQQAPSVDGGHTDGDRIHGADINSGDVNNDKSNQPQKVIVQPVAPSRYTPNSPLKIQLIQQSEKKASLKDYQSAIALAERGLRVDRKEPRFYQVLASAYHGLGNRKQSIYFAKQGLRYAPKESAIAQSLRRWL